MAKIVVKNEETGVVTTIKGETADIKAVIDVHPHVLAGQFSGTAEVKGKKDAVTVTVKVKKAE